MQNKGIFSFRMSLLILSANGAFAQASGFFLPQGQISPWQNGRSPVGSIVASDFFTGSENPAGLMLATVPVASVSFLGQTDIENGWLTGTQVNGYQSWEPATVSLIVPFKSFAIGTSFYQDFYGFLDFGKIPVTTIYDHEGTGEFLTGHQKDKIQTAEISLAGIIPFEVKGIRAISAGLRFNYHWLKSENVFSEYKKTGSGTTDSWAVGILVETESAGTLGLYFLDNPETDLRINTNYPVIINPNESPIFQTLTMNINIADEWVLSYGTELLGGFNIEWVFIYQLLNATSKNLENGYELSLAVNKPLVETLLVSAGLWAKERHYTDDFYDESGDLIKPGDLTAFWFTAGLSYRLGPIILDGTFMGDTGLSGKYQKQYAGRLTVAYQLEW